MYLCTCTSELSFFQEEELFKWTPTTYPELESLHSSLEPYQRLFTTILRWQKTEKRLMDGSLLELNAEDTEAEVEEFWREMYKLSKLFTTKAKQMKKDRDIGQSVSETTAMMYFVEAS